MDRTPGVKKAKPRAVASAWLLSLLIHAGFMGFLAVSTAAINHFESPVNDISELNVSFVAPTYDVPPITPEHTEPAQEQPRVVDWQRVEEVIAIEPTETEQVELADETVTLQNTAGVDLASLDVTGGGSGIAFVESRFDSIPQRKISTPAPEAATAGGGSGSGAIGVGGTQGSGTGAGTGSGSGTGTGSGSGPGNGNASPSGLGTGSGKGIGAGEGSGRAALSRPPRPKQTDRGPYPSDARRAGVEGVVTLAIEVLATGKVGSVGIAQSSGHSSLDKAAIEAAQRWRFDPAEAGGRAVDAQVEIRYRFKLVDAR